MTAGDAALHLRELGRLLQLRERREDQARRRVAAALGERDAVLATLREREAEIESLRGRRSALARQVVGPAAPTLARWMPFAHAERERLDDLLERAEYALIDDEDDLERAQAQLDAARQDWQRALARVEALRGLCEQARRQRMRAAEGRAEREDPARPGRTA